MTWHYYFRSSRLNRLRKKLCSKDDTCTLWANSGHRETRVAPHLATISGAIELGQASAIVVLEGEAASPQDGNSPSKCWSLVEERPMDGRGVALFLIATFLGGFTTGLTGFAAGLVASGIWLHLITPMQTAVLIAAYGVVNQGYGIWKV